MRGIRQRNEFMWSSTAASSQYSIGAFIPLVFKRSIFKAKNLAVLLNSSLHVSVATGCSSGLNFNGNLHLDARAGRKLQNDFIDQVSELLLRLERVKFDAFVKLLLDRFQCYSMTGTRFSAR